MYPAIVMLPFDKRLTNQDEANLARIRDNQRRSRARRKEYQQELEQRVRAFEELGIEASTEVQQAARRVAEENRKLRTLLQNNGISHASIEAYLQTGDISTAMAITTANPGSFSGATTTAAARTLTTGTNSSALDHLMVPRFPAHYVSPLGGGTGALSVSGSVGPSSPAGGSVGGDGGGGSDWEASITRDVGVMATHSSASSPPIALRNTSSRTSGSHRSHRSSSDNKAKRSSTGAPSSSSQRHMANSAMMQTATAAAGDYTTSGSSNTDYLSPGYGLSNAAFYGLEGASTEDLQYTSNEPTFFDYSASPHYYGGSSGGNVAAMGGNNSTGNAMPGINQTHGAAAYYGQVSSIMSGSSSGACAACLSGMGCQVHGGFFEEQ
ncbi:hypothetical protein F503_05716 [Ophiostoma piceae UAMH 11346]|uniref:Bzip transcription factor n=1 Tax=Ophiostoma piceae (strain UAMH 11346) TaxID=1262450 RepID=S3CEV4_OPHP1|nr:hypothetical protein F503_05716 [Ophiostoma piceae UAMH 11346]